MRTFRGQSVDGELYLDDPEAFAKHVKAMPGPVEVIVRSGKPLRSVNQSRYYFGVVVPALGQHCGYDNEEMHETLKARFLLTRDEGHVATMRSTKDLTTAEFVEYVEHCRRLAAELGVVIPDPGECP